MLNKWRFGDGLINTKKDIWEEQKTFFKYAWQKVLAIVSIIVVILTSSFLGVVTFAIDMVEIHEEQIDMREVIPKWFEQLPESDWLKSDEDYIFTDCVYELTCIEQGLYSISSTLFKMFTASLGQTDSKTLEFIGAGLEKQYERNKELYVLKDSKNKKVNVLKIDTEERKKLHFYYGKEEYKFHFTKEELGKNVSTRMVYSYVEEPEIARIYKGEIEGFQKGEATLHLLCNGYHFIYKVKVK